MCGNLFSLLLFKYVHNSLDFVSWSTKPEIFIIWTFSKMFANFPLRMMKMENWLNLLEEKDPVLLLFF